MHKLSAPRLNYSCAASGELLKNFQQLNAPLGNIVTSRHWTVLPATPLSDALIEMEQRDSDVAVVVSEENHLEGIFTKRDLLSRVVCPRMSLDLPISSAMTRNPVALQTSALGYEAIVAMVHGGFHHVVLLEDRQVVGVVSEHDLFALQQVSFGQISATINAADNLDKVRSCTKEIGSLVEYMFVQGVAPDQVTRIISTLNDQLIKRVIELEMSEHDHKDLRICWIIMGSEGRYEQTISTDQDNGIIFQHSKHTSADKVRDWLQPIAARINKSLDYVGFPLCKGNVMAGNPDCCLSLSEWKKKFHNWIVEPTPESLLNVSIYFDFRPIYGQFDLADELRSWLVEATCEQHRFLSQMSEIALQKTPPFTLFNSFFQDNHPDVPNSTDLKVKGISVFVDAARVYALASGIVATNTLDRLLQAAKKLRWPENTTTAWTDSFNFLQGIRIRHQHHLQKNGIKAHNRLDLCALNALEQRTCAEAFRQAGKLQKQLEAEFISKRMGGSMGA